MRFPFIPYQTICSLLFVLFGPPLHGQHVSIHILSAFCIPNLSIFECKNALLKNSGKKEYLLPERNYFV